MKKSKVAALYSIAALDKFSFNGIRALLVVFLVRKLNLSDVEAYQYYASVMALAFMTPLICGYLAGKISNSTSLLIYSCFWTALGLFALMFPWRTFFYFSMAALVIGSGFIKTMVPTLLGTYAQENNQNKDAIFTKLYVFFNVGSLTGTIGCSIVGETTGWEYGFAIAGLGMLVASILAMYITFPINLANTLVRALSNNLIILILVCASMFLLNFSNLFSIILCIAFVFSLFIFIYFCLKKYRECLKNLPYLFVLMIMQALFLALYEQSSLSLILFVDRMVDRSLGAFVPFFSNSTIIPVTFFQTIDPLFNIILGSIFIKLWSCINNKFEMGYLEKFLLGFVFIGIAFFILGFSYTTINTLISPWYLVAVYIFFVLGEQCVIPIGFSAVSSLTPKEFLSFAMGIWFVSIAFSELLAELLSKKISSVSMQSYNVKPFFNIFTQVSFTVLGIAFVIYLVQMSWRKYIKLNNRLTFSVSIS